MTNWLARWALVVWCVVVWAAAAVAAEGPLAAEASAGRFIALSDMHFDPTATRSVMPLLMASEPEHWAAILDAQGPTDTGRFGEDTRWPLLRSALDQMRIVEPSPAFLVVSGDFLAHHFKARFEAAGGDQVGYRAFARKTFAFIVHEIARRFPGTRIFFSLGNNDDVCGDYRLPSGGEFLHDTLPVAHRLLDIGADPAFDADWLAGRGYDVPNGSVAGLRMVFLNTVFLSRNYVAGCQAQGAGDPGSETLDWLARRLEASESRGERVWLVMHIPPGADAFAFLREGFCPYRLLPMWKPDYAPLPRPSGPFPEHGRGELRRPYAHGRVPPDRARRPLARLHPEHARHQPDLRAEPRIPRLRFCGVRSIA